MKSEDALSKGILTTKENYTSKHIWAGPTPRQDFSRTTQIRKYMIASLM
jgi:hypothetical protein